MPVLKEHPILKDLQRYVWELERERGFSEQDLLQKCLLLGEEVGELFKAVRKQQGMSTDVTTKTSDVKEELADVLIMLLSVANRLEVDLEQAFRDKEEQNKQRTWK